MANNYTQFSCSFPVENDEQKGWLKSELDWLERAVDGAFDAEDEHEDEYDGDRLERYRHMLNGGWIGFSYKIEKTDDAYSIWIYAEESGDPEHVVSVLQAFLMDFLLPHAWGFTWANTCSKMRVDEFSGGEVIFNATDATWFPSFSMIQEEKRRLETAAKRWLQELEIPKVIPEQEAIQEAMK